MSGPTACSPVGDWLIRRREALGLSREAVASMSGISFSRVCALESRPNGEYLTLSSLYALAEAYDVDPREFAWRIFDFWDWERDETDEPCPSPIKDVM